MRIIDGLLAELEQEAATTKRVLERIPQEHLSWRPHPKSMSLGQLALHVATVPGLVAEIAAKDTTMPSSFFQPEAATAAELTPALAERMHRGIPGSQVVIFEDSAHVPHLEETERYLQVLANFLDRVETRA